jgi:hypothetical protein
MIARTIACCLVVDRIDTSSRRPQPARRLAADRIGISSGELAEGQDYEDS